MPLFWHNMSPHRLVFGHYEASAFGPKDREERRGVEADRQPHHVWEEFHNSLKRGSFKGCHQ